LVQLVDCEFLGHGAVLGAILAGIVKQGANKAAKVPLFA